MSDTEKTETGGVSNTIKPPLSKTRSRNWCFTLNNYTDTHINFIKNLKCEYVFQAEKGESGTDHLQGLLIFKEAKSFESIKKLLPTAHIEKCKNLEASKKYCSKEETREAGPWISPGIKINAGEYKKPKRKSLDCVELCKNAITDIMNMLTLEQAQYPERFGYMEKITRFMDPWVNPGVE